MLERRIEKLRKILKEKNIDAFLVSNFYNVLYLTGFKTLTDDEREAWTLVTAKNVYLFTDSRYLNNKLQISNTKSTTNNKFLILKLITPDKGLIAHLTDITEEEKIKHLGFEGEDLKVNELQRMQDYLPNIKMVPIERLIVKIREVKDEEEIKNLKTACKIADECLTDIVKIIRPGTSEKEIAFKIEFWLKEKGYDVSFYPIIAINKNSAVPHYDTRNGNDEKIKKDSIILIDYGAKYKDYHSDTTRMIFTGKPTDEMANIYNKLLEAQTRTIEELKTDNSPVSVDQFCRRLITEGSTRGSTPTDSTDSTDYRLPSYPHSTGHGVGLHIHEFPKISFTSTDVLLPNHVITIEPGVYFDNKWGMRIEDTVLITEKGKIEVLTRFNKKLTIISNY